MPVKGTEKAELNFVGYRAKQQTALWTRVLQYADGEWTGEIKPDDDILPELKESILNPKIPFRSEGLSVKELWRLYIGVTKLTEEEESRGKKKDKETAVEPIKARRVVGWRVLDANGRITDEWSYTKTQYIGRSRPNGKFNDQSECALHFHDDGYLNFQNWLLARDQARKDLMFLSFWVLRNYKITRATHQFVCDQFVQKNFDGVYTPGYSVEALTGAIEQQNRVPIRWNPYSFVYEPAPGELSNSDNYHRLMMLLFSRGFFKSTINRADAIQWMLNCPDISMLIMTAARDLSAEFFSDIKKQFYLAKGAEPDPIHILFPEYILRGVDGTSAEDLVCPARRISRTYPTLWHNSVDSTVSGWHCDVLKFDDVVSNSNGLTEQTRAKLRKQIDNILNLCDTWGKVDMLGTRYFPDDYYGTRLEAAERDPEAAGLKYFIGACWYVKPEYMAVAKRNLRDLKEDMVILTFPEHASFKYLRGLLITNEQEFRCQQLNEPVWGDSFSIYFNEVDLEAAKMSPMEAQRLRGDTYVIWDTAKEAKKNSDYSVGVAIKIFQKEETGKVSAVLLEVIFDKWTQSQIVHNMASFNQKWMPKVCQIEDTGGLELMKNEVRKIHMQMDIPANVYWRQPDNEDNAKRNRIKSLEVLLKEKRLFFVEGHWLRDKDGVFPQLMQYTGEKSTRSRKDDIPDAMAHIVRYLPSSAPLSPKEQEDKARREEEQYQSWVLFEQHRRMFGSGTIQPRLPSLSDLPQLENTSPYSEIAGKLFGSNGMKA